MRSATELIPRLFRTEYSKIVAVLCAHFGIDHIETAEDIASDTFLTATELWGLKGVPENPAAWLYTVAKNKTKNHLKRNTLFAEKIAPEIKQTAPLNAEIDLSETGIADSVLAMIFTICDPVIATEAQIALALNLLCGFGVQEIATAFLTGKDTIYKRIQRAKEKLREAKIDIAIPGADILPRRMESVLITLYLLFNEGYYSVSGEHPLKKECCSEAMRLTLLLLENERTNLPAANALMALMCFHASRFEARTNQTEDLVLYNDQDVSLWDQALIEKGCFYLNQAAQGPLLTKYHLEAGIAYWHTHPGDSREKWEAILQLYNQLLILEYSPVAALNRTFALAKANGVEAAIVEAEKLQLLNNHFYFVLLGTLYSGKDDKKALTAFEQAYTLAQSAADKQLIQKKIDQLAAQN
ncbi:MAG: RNA polymerase subunit sigma [Niabella sp.]|nr:RNA polymerase subunit sigma [Niabella sp.]